MLKDVFLDFYRFAENKSGSIADMGEWVNGRWCWHFSWVDDSDSDGCLAGPVLSDLLKEVQPVFEGKDRWNWGIRKEPYFYRKVMLYIPTICWFFCRF